ncbi:hypothetical protein F4W70_27425, partial [Pseudomonas cannabina]|uniref:hypothetical protein n=1 Tax=Pseudomonas cannabina TaxID=86840 RepID=UPI0012386A11
MKDRSQVRQIVKRDTSDLTRLSPAQAKAFGDAVMADFTITIQLKASKYTCGGSCIGVTTCNRNGPDLQSSRFSTGINCVYPAPRTSIDCKRTCIHPL